ncbi:MAG: GtrA family protein [Patescibacteria group bacterium]
MAHETIIALLERYVPERYVGSAKQFLKFAVVGSVGAIVDFGSYNIMTRLFDWNTIYHVFGLQIIAANLVSVFVAIMCNFLLNKYWTFRNPSKSVLQQGAGYFTLNFITFVLNQILTSFFAFQVPIVGAVFGNQRDNAAKVISVGFILFINFFGSKFIIFRKKPVQTVENSVG